MSVNKKPKLQDKLETVAILNMLTNGKAGDETVYYVEFTKAPPTREAKTIEVSEGVYQFLEGIHPVVKRQRRNLPNAGYGFARTKGSEVYNVCLLGNAKGYNTGLTDIVWDNYDSNTSDRGYTTEERVDDSEWQLDNGLMRIVMGCVSRKTDRVVDRIGLNSAQSEDLLKRIKEAPLTDLVEQGTKLGFYTIRSASIQGGKLDIVVARSSD